MVDRPLPPSPPPPRPMDLGDFKALSVLGRGAKGVVFLVRTDSKTLALKAISKSHVEHRTAASDGAAYRRIWFERDVLLALRHPLLPSLRGVVSTDRIVGFAIDRCPGGDLNALRQRQTEKMFSDDIIRFYAAELVIALEYLHGLGIVYRDLKPENVLIQDTGHLMLVDFDLSTKLPSRLPDPLKTPKSVDRRRATPAPRRKKKRSPGCFSCNAGVSPESNDSTEESPPPPPPSGKSEQGKSNSFVGTEDYVAPEIIQGKGHDFAVDWWSFGVVLYEMLYGRTPFRGQNRKETFYRILNKEPELVGERTPLRDLIGQLLDKDPARRISAEGIKGHDFFRTLDWESVMEIARPPFIPAGEEDEGMEVITAIDVEKTVDDMFAKVNTEVVNGDKTSDAQHQEEREGFSDPSKTGDFYPLSSIF